MSSIGPAIPSHLLSQRHQAEADEDEAGPAPSASEAAASIGPSIPSHLLNREASIHIHDAESLPVTEPVVAASKIPPTSQDDDSDDDYGPALPPDLAASSSSKKLGPAAPQQPRGPVMGPSMPPQHGFYEDDDDDDDVGPRPLPAGYAARQELDPVAEFMEREERRRKEREDALKPKVPQREEWMLVPPSSSALLGTLDPAKLSRPRTFRATAAPAASSQDTSLWTETPAERAQRLADEVSGKRRRAANSEAPVDERTDLERRKRARVDEDIRRGVDEHTKRTRGAALVEAHNEKLKKEPKKDDEPKAIWDRDRDMGLSGRVMDSDKRNKMIKEARGLGDRFSSGSSGGFYA
ncbi:unnamed protein product [Mycena citricolor]|uniref:DUF3752 domain-containing protein n=1 Tax=Mycena citricolor TaxID=2018698 RepID=A0AAD2HH51_9AGAR|nr:unnamed protein product [Mycena citricolor]